MPSWMEPGSPSPSAMSPRTLNLTLKSGTTLKTPLLWCCTKGGIIPNLTPETLAMMDFVPNILVPGNYFVPMADVLEAHGKGKDSLTR